MKFSIYLNRRVFVMIKRILLKHVLHIILTIFSCPKCAQWRRWSYCATDLNLRWVHTSEGTSLDVGALMIWKSLRKNAYSNILKILPPKKENFQIKTSDIFHIPTHNIDCGYSLELPRRGGSNEYPQSMFFSKIRKIMYTPVNPSFTIWKWGLRGSKLYRRVFVM